MPDIHSNRSRAQEALSGLQYVVELRVSPTPIDPYSVPLLDIFDIYRLFSEIGCDNGRVRHALQLGYFKESGTAASVASYLAGYFDRPRVVQTMPSRALHLKFVPLKDIGVTGTHSVIELPGERPTPPQLATQSRLPAPSLAPKLAQASNRRCASPSLLSRILYLHR